MVGDPWVSEGARVLQRRGFAGGVWYGNPALPKWFGETPVRKFELQTKVVQKSICAHVKGDVDSGNALALRDALEELVKTGPGVVFLDLAEVRLMDSAGIAVLVEVHERMKKQGRQLGLINTPGPVKGMLELLDVFDIYSDLETGLKETKKISAQWQRLHDRTKPQI